MTDDIVIVDPTRNFGKPMFAVSGAPVEDVLDRLRAGESLVSVQEDFGLTVAEAIYCQEVLFGESANSAGDSWRRSSALTQETGTMAVEQGDKMTEPIRDALRTHLFVLRPSDAVVVADDDGWSAFIPGLPFFTAYGADHGEVVDDMIVALREYAEDWNDHLYNVSNHRDHWAVVALTELSTDEQLKEWLLATTPDLQSLPIE